jgi:16S rRNA A1518/A1519 N6-dimethyltransferase RsmA/KsgA/DIM1 with predicted DNA glycosylase/AP lyase activity
METRKRKQICLAQNFLKSPKLVRRLVWMSTIGPSDLVFEIGPGSGIITAELASVARRVIAIEKDPALVCRLRERFRSLENVEIVEKDFLDYSLPKGNSSAEVGQQIQASHHKMFASIPYNVTSRVLRRCARKFWRCVPGIAERGCNEVFRLPD